MEIRRLLPDDADFPKRLRHIPDPPKQLFVRGDLAGALTRPTLAVVGSRKPTVYGRQVTSRLAGLAAGQGITIISGLAIGVDALAHTAALDAGGLTIAVLGSGPDRPMPAVNDWLARRLLAQGGVVVSEYPPGTPVQKYHFVARNRLVAGLCQALLITEAAAGSGSRHTADFALEQGRTVLAVPGNITSPNSELTNRLIQDGAGLVGGLNDILLALDLPPVASGSDEVPDDDVIAALLQAVDG